VTSPTATPAPAPGRPLARRLLKLALSALVFLLAAELACRFFVSPPMQVEVQATTPVLGAPDAEEKVVRTAKRPGQGLYNQTPTGRRLRPNTTAVIENHSVSGRAVEVRTNSLGYRNPELSDKTGKRFLFLGDSITFADYLPEEESFVRRVEAIARARGLEWETVNAGVGSISLKTYLAILLETGLTTQPDVVVLGWYLNDFQDSPGVAVHVPSFLERTSRLAAVIARMRARASVAGVVQQPWKQWWAEWAQKDQPALVGGDPARAAFYQEVSTYFNDWGGAWSPHAWDEMRPVLAELVRVTRASGAEIAWLAFPARPQVEAPFDASYPQQRLAELATELDVPLLDLLPVLRELAARGETELFHDQCHHTGAASAQLAEAIVEFLAAR